MLLGCYPVCVNIKIYSALFSNRSLCDMIKLQLCKAFQDYRQEGVEEGIEGNK